MTAALPGFGVIRSAPGVEAVPAYRVLGACILVKDAEGLTHHAYHGALIEWLNPQQEKQFVEEGLVERIAKK